MTDVVHPAALNMSMPLQITGDRRRRTPLLRALLLHCVFSSQHWCCSRIRQVREAKKHAVNGNDLPRTPFGLAQTFRCTPSTTGHQLIQKENPESVTSYRPFTPHI